jgi:hypothetical protein
MKLADDLRDENNGERDPMSPTIKDEYRVRLEQIVTTGSTLKYEYDFGASWLHDIKIEKLTITPSG